MIVPATATYLSNAFPPHVGLGAFGQSCEDDEGNPVDCSDAGATESTPVSPPGVVQGPVAPPGSYSTTGGTIVPVSTSGPAPVAGSSPAPVVNVYTNSSGQQQATSAAPSWVQTLATTLAASGMQVVKMAATPQGYYQATIQNPNGTTSTVTYNQPAGSQSLNPVTGTVSTTLSSLSGYLPLLLIGGVALLVFSMAEKR